MGIVLALDYGEAHIGLAVTDDDRRTALAEGSMNAQPEEETLRALRTFLSERDVEHVVLGLPLTLQGDEGPQAARVRAFGASLAAATGMTIEYFDERFSTREAEAAVRAKGKGDIDAEAARLILDSWLLRRKRST